MKKTFSRSTFLGLKMGSLSLATQKLACFSIVFFITIPIIHSKYKPFLITMTITILKIVN